MSEIILWIFNNVMPWLGIIFAVLTIVYFIVIIVLAFTRDSEDNFEHYDGAWDFATMQTGGATMIVGIFGILMVAFAAFLIERIMRLPKWFRKRLQKEIRSERPDTC